MTPLTETEKQARMALLDEQARNGFEYTVPQRTTCFEWYDLFLGSPSYRGPEPGSWTPIGLAYRDVLGQVYVPVRSSKGGDCVTFMRLLDPVLWDEGEG
jgi:hypothetical protein